MPPAFLICTQYLEVVVRLDVLKVAVLAETVLMGLMVLPLAPLYH